MHLITGVVAYNLCFALAGYGVLAALGRRPALGDAGLAYLTGVAVLLVPASALVTAGYVSSIPVFLAFTAFFACGLLIRGRPQIRWSAREVIASARSWRPSYSTLSRAIFSAAVGAYGLVLVRLSAVYPNSAWDAWGMWTMKAKALIVYGNLHVADFAAESHPDYPILVPMLQSFSFRFMGQINTEVVHVQYALLALAFVATIWRTMNARLGVAAAAAWALYALLLPGFEANVPDALGDVPVGIFASLAAFAFAMWLKEGRGREWLPLYIFFGAAAVWSKNEGLSAVLIVALVGVLVSIKRPFVRSVVPPVLASAAIYLLFLPWLEWTKANGIGHDRNLSAGLHPVLLIRDHSRATRALSDLWGQLSNLDTWFALPYLSLLLVFVAVVRGRNRRLAMFALLVPAGLLLSYVVIYTISTDPLGLGWLLSTSSSRIVTSVGLIAVALLPVQALTILEPRGLASANGSEEVPDT